MVEYCDREGLKCCNAVIIKKKKCLKPCFGIYADVYSIPEDYQKSIKSWDVVLQSYKDFKNMFGTNISFPQELNGKLIDKSHNFVQKYICNIKSIFYIYNIIFITIVKVILRNPHKLK